MLIVQKHLQAVTKALTGKDVASIGELLDSISNLQDIILKLENTKADFLWPFEECSLEEAGYEFCNAKTEEYRKEWWDILVDKFALSFKSKGI